jgi:hydrogenase maturation protease
MDTSKQRPRRPLVIGYGNPHRQDDRVGHIVAEAVQQWADGAGLPLEVVTAYQLDLDMVEQISAASLVVFVDAHTPSFCDGLACTQIVPDDDAGFTTHAFTPGGLLALAARLTGRAPQAFIVSVPGFAFDLGDEISARTRALAADAVAQVQRLARGD